MSRRSKTLVAELWINPISNFKQFGYHAWDRRSTDAPNARYLELADVALRLQKATAAVEPAVEHAMDANGNDSNL